VAAQADAETIAAFRELVDRVVIIDAPNNAVEVQVIGRPAASSAQTPQRYTHPKTGANRRRTGCKIGTILV
jgi:hypothetical protein